MAQGGTTALPQDIPGFGPVRPFAGAYGARGEAGRAEAKSRGGAQRGKLLPGIRAAIEACGIRDGATLSFHHHLRNGDGVLNAVLAEVAAMGLRDIRVAASSIFPVHAPLVGHIRSGVVHRHHDQLRRGSGCPGHQHVPADEAGRPADAWR